MDSGRTPRGSHPCGEARRAKIARSGPVRTARSTASMAQESFLPRAPIADRSSLPKQHQINVLISSRSTSSASLATGDARRWLAIGAAPGLRTARPFPARWASAPNSTARGRSLSATSLHRALIAPPGFRPHRRPPHRSPWRLAQLVTARASPPRRPLAPAAEPSGLGGRSAPPAPPRRPFAATAEPAGLGGRSAPPAPPRRPFAATAEPAGLGSRGAPPAPPRRSLAATAETAGLGSRGAPSPPPRRPLAATTEPSGLGSRGAPPPPPRRPLAPAAEPSGLGSRGAPPAPSRCPLAPAAETSRLGSRGAPPASDGRARRGHIARRAKRPRREIPSRRVGRAPPGPWRRTLAGRPGMRPCADRPQAGDFVLGELAPHPARELSEA